MLHFYVISQSRTVVVYAY